MGIVKVGFYFYLTIGIWQKFYSNVPWAYKFSPNCWIWLVTMANERLFFLACNIYSILAEYNLHSYTFRWALWPMGLWLKWVTMESRSASSSTCTSVARAANLPLIVDWKAFINVGKQCSRYVYLQSIPYWSKLQWTSTNHFESVSTPVLWLEIFFNRHTLKLLICINDKLSCLVWTCFKAFEFVKTALFSFLLIHFKSTCRNVWTMDLILYFHCLDIDLFKSWSVSWKMHQLWVLNVLKMNQYLPKTDQ